MALTRMAGALMGEGFTLGVGSFLDRGLVPKMVVLCF